MVLHCFIAVKLSKTCSHAYFKITALDHIPVTSHTDGKDNGPMTGTDTGDILTTAIYSDIPITSESESYVPITSDTHDKYNQPMTLQPGLIAAVATVIIVLLGIIVLVVIMLLVKKRYYIV